MLWFRPGTFRPAIELNCPNCSTTAFLYNMPGFLCGNFFVGEHTCDVEHGGVGPVEKRKYGVAQNVLRRGPQLFSKHTLNTPITPELMLLFMFGSVTLGWVKPAGRGVSRVEIYHVFYA